MTTVLHKDSIKEIINTRKRFLSILLIVLLGVGFFAGIRAASPDMKKTAVLILFAMTSITMAACGISMSSK